MNSASTNKLIKGLGFNHISITTRKMEESLHFYCDILGMTIENELMVGDRQLFQLNIGDGMLVELSDPTAENRELPSTPIPLNHIGLVTDDLLDTVERVRSAGYEITVEPRRTGPGPIHASLAFVKGPNGESIEFMQMD